MVGRMLLAIRKSKMLLQQTTEILEQSKATSLQFRIRHAERQNKQAGQ